ncbi:FISUMP domain-containing protein [Winogradskyella sp.]|uniref:FISUMP domain-containing protein n=1 Tax=Winogradskyella sp. TaxID=1883156 RepID=UPI003F6C5DF8
MKKLISPFLLVLLLPFMTSCSDDDNNSDEEPTTVTDIDGNVYNTITLGGQTWMLENLKVTTFNDGTPITLYEFPMDWVNFNEPMALYQFASTNDLNDVVDIEMPFDYYGALYNHYALESGKLAPEGWRIPSVQDFMELEAYLSANGFDGMEAGALKSDSGWLPSSGNGTDAIGFTGLPNGYSSTFGTSTFTEGVCTWATTDVNIDIPLGSRPRVMVQLFDNTDINFVDNSVRIGAGVRCIKNE